jgi:hypothetical protein
MEKAHRYEALYLVNHGIDEAVRGVQSLKKSPNLLMGTYHKSMSGLERRRSINLQFMLEMRELEENDESYFEEEFKVWLSDEPLTNDEVCWLMREVERQRKHEGRGPPRVVFLPDWDMRDEQRYDETQTEPRKKAAKSVVKKVPKPKPKRNQRAGDFTSGLKRMHHEGRRLSHDQTKNAHPNTLAARSDTGQAVSRHQGQGRQLGRPRL